MARKRIGYSRVRKVRRVRRRGKLLRNRRPPRTHKMPRDKRPRAHLKSSSVPFTLSFQKGHKHKSSALEGQTLVIARTEYNWCNKLAKIAIDDHALKHGRFDILTYKVHLHNLVSELVVEKEYTKYIHEKNKALLKYLPHHHHGVGGSISSDASHFESFMGKMGTDLSLADLA